MDGIFSIPRGLFLALIWLFAVPYFMAIAQKAPLTDRDLLYQIYTAEIGVREASGNNDGPEVEAYLATTGLDKGYAWCSAFVSWVFQQGGFDTPRTAWSPALFPKRVVIWPNQGKSPQKSDVFGIYYPNLKRIGHVGFIVSWGANFVTTVEGNTNENGSSEGDGVYRKRRRTKTIHSVADWVSENQQ